MDDNYNKSDENQPLQSSKALEYLFKRLLELENRIEALEEKNAAAPKTESALLSKADSIEEKLDLLIKQIQGIPTANEIEDIGGRETNVQPEMRSADMKRSVAVFIDGENISNKKAEKIMEKSRNRGEIRFARVYNVKDTPSDKCWVNTA